MFNIDVIENLKNGGVGVIPTDTLYGLVGRADMKDTVGRIYKIKERSSEKPCIILISSLNDLEKFNVKISDEIRKILEKYWPGQVSVVLPTDDNNFDYLTRGTGSLAFRLPDNKKFQELIKKTGPLIAPSANPEGEEPARTIELAKQYFNDKVDFYIDGGELKGDSSTLIKFENGKIVVLRKGVVSF